MSQFPYPLIGTRLKRLHDAVASPADYALAVPIPASVNLYRYASVLSRQPCGPGSVEPLTIAFDLDPGTTVLQRLRQTLPPDIGVAGTFELRCNGWIGTRGEGSYLRPPHRGVVKVLRAL